MKESALFYVGLIAGAGWCGYRLAENAVASHWYRECRKAHDLRVDGTSVCGERMQTETGVPFSRFGKEPEHP
jgi:hypothetical protein